MKRCYIFATVALMGLSACATKLSPQDRALLTETRSYAERALSQSSMALAEAKAARDAATKAALEAQASGKKADRIFREAQQK